MKKTINISVRKMVPLFLAGAFVGSVGCTSDFESINNNPNGLDANQIPVESRFAMPMQSIYLNYQNRDYEYQLQQNLNADLYSGYLANPTPFGGNNNNSTYSLNDGWNNVPFKAGLLYVMKPVAQIIESAGEMGYSDYIALAKIIRVAAIHRVSDIYGPVPYSKAMQGGQSVPYDSQESLYNQFFNELEEAANILTTFVDNDPAAANARIKSFDQMCEGDYVRWIRFANTLRLRLAMRIVKVNPTKAKEEAEAAIAQKYGVLTSADKNIEVKSDILTNPLQVICFAYNDCRVGASYESILKGYADPRLEKTMLPIGWMKKDGEPRDILDKEGKPLGYIGKYVGIRQGAILPDKSNYEMYSNINMSATDKSTMSYPLPIMKVAEAYFLRAEGALRGWNVGGSAQELYEEGIRVSFNEHDISSSAYDIYIADDTRMAADYVDPFNTGNNIKGVNKVTVKWDNGADNEVKLQKIITQKWIAMFPEGQEAWSEFRRTGYPKLFPVVENRSGGAIPNGEFIKRLPFTLDERNTNLPAVEEARQLLNGPDNAGTRLWWDVNKANF
ncbi:MAG: SusD/RagB family nutrient-binding outer membrane lipoprotein [Bacteroidales bacterium]